MVTTSAGRASGRWSSRLLSRGAAWARAAVLAPLLVAGTVALPPGAAVAAGGDVAEGEQESKLFYELEPLNVAVVQRGRFHGSLRLNLVLEATDADARAQVISVTPRLRDAYISNLSFYVRERYDPRSHVNVAYVAALLQEATDEILGGPHADVLVQEARLIR
ncbi:hypothetical protein EV659_11151 [Rhodothalassium salexigens DSM 2132]|uniref:Flagellar protein FliL n=1 Tax=Rhodothalassium salexigens DSM 2132 TaxID=1188247 RepID=A0A4R2PBI4_RHOSA|nr:flagellar basal body-associated FliL family protein [Rhodothalassium salexigens]MBB4212477.1 hypothetical protein [Rhodothalassium salexigens DSM 2132]MBK1639533.1 hypothetical protein [Rhodothalassium salexigens DSM 2132]TCP31481.1 hypothetical protein EV659_11151 [Rhodothalassium salexigens DSM 2132]